MSILFAGNDNNLEVDKLTNEASGSVISNATVTVALEDLAGTEILAAQTMPAVGGSAGKYRYTVEDTLALVPGTVVIAVFTADGDGLTATWRRPYTVQTRV